MVNGVPLPETFEEVLDGLEAYVLANREVGTEKEVTGVLSERPVINHLNLSQTATM